MTQESNVGLDMKGLLAKIEREGAAQEVNWTKLSLIFTNLGKTVTTLPEKAIDESTFLQMFAKLSQLLDSYADTIPLRCKILIIMILQNSAIILAKKQFITQVDIALSIITDQFENECSKETPNVGYLISILDSIFQFVRFQIGDNKEFVDTINNLNNIVGKLSESKKLSLRHALRFSMAKNDQNHAFMAFEKDLRKLFSALGVSTKLTQRSTNAIPARPAKSKDLHLKIQNMLVTYTTEIVLNLVIDGFKKINPSPNFKLPETINQTIQEIMRADQEITDYDMHEVNIETSAYIVEQGLEKMTQRMKFTSQKVQSHFLAMIICTTDQSEGDSYLTCTGKCTETAIRCASADLGALLPFLINWVGYEFVKSPRERYVLIAEKIAIAICTKISEKDDEKESAILVFLRSLPAIDPSIFVVLADQVDKNALVSRTIIFAMANVVQNTPLVQEDSLEAILKLCISTDPTIRKNAIDLMIKNFHAGRLFVEKIEDSAKKCLEDGAVQEDAASAERYLNIYFEILKENVDLLQKLLEMYEKMNENVQKSVRSHLITQMPQIGFNVDIIKKLFDNQTNNNIKLIHFILDNLSKISQIPTQMTTLIREQFEKTDDGRFLIPIIPTLTETEFFNYIPTFLKLKNSGLKRAFEIYIMQKHSKQAKNPLVNLISELLKPIEAKPYKKQIIALDFCMRKKDVIDYPIIAAAVNKSMPSSAQQKKNYDLICEPLLFIVEEYSEHAKHVEKLCESLIKYGVYNNDFIWPKMIQIFEKTNMFKIYSLPIEKIEEVAKKCPKLLTFMKNDALKKRNIPKKVVQLLESL